MSVSAVWNSEAPPRGSRHFSNLSCGTVDTVPMTDDAILDAVVFR